MAYDILSTISTTIILPNIAVQILPKVTYSAEIRLLQKENIDNHSEVSRETLPFDIASTISKIILLLKIAVQLLSKVTYSA